MHLEKTRLQYRKGCNRNEVPGAVGAGEEATWGQPACVHACVCMCISLSMSGEKKEEKDDCNFYLKILQFIQVHFCKYLMTLLSICHLG